ncbi:transposase [Rhizobium mongolense]|uniref:Transposase n=2 Tax=Rhizobium mongolense TaxID=57676 RepID=A0ABR6IZ31_9HYPH|nr:transposase [Rhizobium mongolense]TVZ75277.1 transposase [Rhizobium mongolense USDA 1844]
MRGGDVRTGELFSYVDLEDRVRNDHPLRAIRQIVNDALVSLEGEFAALYSPIGRPSIAPEKLLRVMLLQAFYSIRSERLLMERLEYELLFRWFVDIGVDDPAWDHSKTRATRPVVADGLLSALPDALSGTSTSTTETIRLRPRTPARRSQTASTGVSSTLFEFLQYF